MSPSWSPGGEWIAFVLDDVIPGNDRIEIYVVDATANTVQTPRKVSEVDVFNTLTWRRPTPLLLPAPTP